MLHEFTSQNFEQGGVGGGGGGGRGGGGGILGCFWSVNQSVTKQEVKP